MYDDAISYYTKAIEHAESNDDELHIYYSNSKVPFPSNYII